ncbi:MAG: hypothetical protein ACXVCP_07960 [Bdellovibrio sp.]
MALIRVSLVFFLLSSVVALKAWSQGDAAQDVQIDEAKEAEISLKAKKRLYPGGRDEEDLKVQSQIANPTRKVSPQAEVKEEPVEE